MCEEYNSILSTPIEADEISCFGQYQFILQVTQNKS